jgi:hypothetical protein
MLDKSGMQVAIPSHGYFQRPTRGDASLFTPHKFAKFMGGEPRAIFQPCLANMFRVFTAVTGKIFVHIFIRLQIQCANAG